MITRKVIQTTLVACLLAACGNGGGTIYRKDTFGDTQVLALDARQRLVIQKGQGPDSIICTEPSPDAIVAQAVQVASNANVGLPQGTTNRAANLSLSGGQSEAAASIAMRTQTIQLLRDGYFRLCEAYMNKVIEPWRYRSTISFIDEFIATIAAIEAIGGIVQSAPVTIWAGGSAGAPQTGSSGASVQGGGEAGDLKVNDTNLSAEQASAIATILAAYYKRKAEYLESVHSAQPNQN